jgi:hypothetical protein
MEIAMNFKRSQSCETMRHFKKAYLKIKLLETMKIDERMEMVLINKPKLF